MGGRGVGVPVSQTGEVGTRWVMKEVWVVGGRGVGVLMSETGEAGKGRESQEALVVGSRGWDADVSN